MKRASLTETISAFFSYAIYDSRFTVSLPCALCRHFILDRKICLCCYLKIMILPGGSVFIWLFHRISGVSLIILFGIKIMTSFFLFTKDKKPDWALSLHRQPVTDVLILILFTFHSIYGIRTIVMDMGYKKEKRLFWLSNCVATIIAAFLLYLYAVMS